MNSWVSQSNKSLLFTIIYILIMPAVLNAAEKPRVSVTLTTANIKIDGILNEPEWSSSKSIQNFTQSEPRTGQLSSYKTTVTILANHHALFFGIECQDAEHPVTFSKQRDADLTDQDHIRMVIDPFLDGRSGYIFSEYDDSNLSAGDFNQKLFGTRARFNFSPDIQLSSFIQYDSESNSFGTNTRFRWTFHPQGDLFVIYNHNLLDLHDHWIKESNQLEVKLQYTFRK